MNFKEWLLSEEIFPQNNTATVYHRTKSVDSVSNMLTQGFRIGAGCMYGCGLYTTFDINSQFTGYMANYGQYVTKWKVTGLDKYLIFQLQVAKSIHKENFSISNQLKKFNLLNQFQQHNGSDWQTKLNDWDSQQTKAYFSADVAYPFYEQNKWIVTSGIKGIIYRGQSDGYCLVKYDPIEDSTINLLGFAEADVNDYNKKNELEKNQGWVTSTNKASFKSIRANPDSEKRKEFAIQNINDDYLRNLINKKPEELREIIFNLNDDKLVNLIIISNKSLYKKIIVPKIMNAIIDGKLPNNLFHLGDTNTIKQTLKYKSELSANNVINLLNFANDKDEVIELIIGKKPDFSDQDIDWFLSFAKDKDKIAQILGQNHINKLSDDNVRNLLIAATDKDKIAELILNKKTELSDKNVFYLLKSATDKDKIAELILNKKTELSDDNVRNLLIAATDKDKIAELILNKKTELSNNNVRDLLQFVPDKEEMAKLIINKKTELSDNNVNWLLISAPDKEKMAQILGQNYINKLSGENVKFLFIHTVDKQKMAEFLGQNHISKLSGENVSSLFRHSLIKNKDQMAQILNKYHTNKTPEIQKEIDKYLS